MCLRIEYYDPVTGSSGEVIFREAFFRRIWPKSIERRVANFRKITVRKELIGNDACTEFKFID